MPRKKRYSIGKHTVAARRMALRRALETDEERAKRLEQNRLHTAWARQNESAEERERRLEANRIRIARTRKVKAPVTRATLGNEIKEIWGYLKHQYASRLKYKNLSQWMYHEDLNFLKDELDPMDAIKPGYSKLIKEVQQRRPLWDRNHPFNMNRFVIDKLWTEVADAVGQKKLYVRRQWKYLKDSYVRRVKKGMTLEETNWPINRAMEFYKGQLGQFMRYNKNKKPMEPEKLAMEVKQRKPLWDRFHPNHHNRYVLEKLWDEIAHHFGRSRQEVRAKWKNLRDSFRREVQKIPPNDKRYVVTWPYFSILFFLKDQVKGSIQSSEDSDSLSELEEMDITEERNNQEEERIPNEIETERNYPTENTSIDKQNSELSVDNGEDDTHFLMSLLGYFKHMDPLQNLRVRNRIQEAILQELDFRGTSSVSEEHIKMSSPPLEDEDPLKIDSPNYLYPSPSTIILSSSSSDSLDFGEYSKR